MATPSQNGPSPSTRLIQTTVNQVALPVADGLATSLLTGAGALVGSQVALRAGIWMQPRPMPHQMARWLEHPMRLRYRKPEELLGQLGVFRA
jgi:hypothetical protein